MVKLGISLNLLKNSMFPVNSAIFSNSHAILLIFNNAFTNSPKKISFSNSSFCKTILHSSIHSHFVHSST